MPPKQTPYQFKKGLTYVKPLPSFLQALTGINNEEPSDDELNATREEERPQIVVLKEGKHMSEQEVKVYLDSKAKSKDSSSEDDKESDAEDDTPIIDEKTGKLLFRKPKAKKVSKTSKSETIVGSHSKAKNESNMSIKSINEAIDGMKRKRGDSKNDTEKDTNLEKKAKTTKKKSQKVQAHLSFNNDEI
ncbi:1038_t:CDS:2 [Funneliformis geosporum]|uniref:7478_t:CDS:1 n=1 Tax=Funneliformis geosporum TaxID=1117311 RepID=A0A9W4SVI2_9GLOM|nr:1038_t:CDS:2 [Funneliformis geosporum]CAI2183023.1 7478_t:CDS:2 [Funneliformis geosporum]